MPYWPTGLGGGNYLGTINKESNPELEYGQYAAGKIEFTATIEPAEVVNVFPEVWQIRQVIVEIIGWENAGNYVTIYNIWTVGSEQLWPLEGGLPGQVKPDGPEDGAVDNDPTSGISTNKLYAVDIPGTPDPEDHHTYERYRNFRTYLTFCTDETDDFGLWKCSDLLNWSQRTRIDVDKVGSKIDLNELNLYHITIPTTPYYQYRP